MRINIENAIRHTEMPKEGRFVMEELIKHMKQFRDRALEGDPVVLAEFFNLYRFDDDQCGLKDVEFPEPDRFVKRFAEVLEELELMRERRAEALNVAEERRGEILELKKKLATTQYWLDRFQEEFGDLAIKKIQEEHSANSSSQEEG